MTGVHFACAVMNFVGFLGFVMAILIITTRKADGGHAAKRRNHVRRAPTFAA